MQAGAARLRRTNRLRKSKDFQRVGREGARRASPHFVVVVGRLHGGEEQVEPTLGITVSKRVGTAVQRNRVKRRIREWFRRADRRGVGSAAVVVIARRGAAQLDMAQTERELGGLFP